MKAADVLAGPPSPAPPTEQTTPDKEEKSRRVKIWCAGCQMFHRLPRHASEPAADFRQQISE